MHAHSISVPLGIVIRKSPGVTRWAKWAWSVVAVLPGASQENWRELRREGEVVEYHAATVSLELWRSDTEAYLTGLSARVPSIYVVLRETTDPGAAHDVEVLLATASPYDAQDYVESGEEIVEKVPMPNALIGWISAFIEKYHDDQVFIKRKRDKYRTDLAEDGIGDVRISQLTDVYRAPSRTKSQAVH